MGTVAFETNVLKTVDITKTVNLMVDKTVSSVVVLQGSLATAEASADANAGAFGRARLEPLLLLDDFSTPQTLTVEGPGSTTDTVTLASGAASPYLIRTVTIANDPGSLSAASLTTGDGGPAVFSSGVGTSGTLTIEWTSDTDGDGIADPFSAANQIGDNAIGFGLGVVGFPAETFPVNADFEVKITDIDGDFITFGGNQETESVAGECAEAFGEGLLAGAIFGGAVFGGLALIPGAVVLGTGILVCGTTFAIEQFNEDAQLGGEGDSVELNALESIQLTVRFVPEQTSTLDEVEVLQAVSQGMASLAETDTYAQVFEAGAFAFSESLAALSLPEADAFSFV